MHSIERRVQAVQIRQQRQWLWQCGSTGLFCGGVTGCLTALVRIQTDGAFSWIWVMVAVFVPLIAGAGVAAVRYRTLHAAARLIDRACDLKDRTQTALQFLRSRSDDSALRRLQIEDTEAHLQSIDPATVSPIRRPKLWSWGVILSAVAFMMAFLSSPPETLLASVVTNSVVTQVASQAADSMEELKEFQEEQDDPALEKMLHEMNEQLKQLTEPSVEPKEALAKLSEMESALQDMQKQLSAPAAEVQLREIGEALSLSQALSAAGQAMSKGEMQKAADELDKSELPSLDRKTEKAIAEKLEQAQQKAREGTQNKQSLSEALEKMCQGMSSGDKDKFAEGTKQLAGECRKQGQKQKLADLLRKQSQSLAECKSQCESESRNLAQGTRKGGQKAGKGSGSDPKGEKSARLKTGQEMKLQGQDSGSGDVDLETTTNPEQEQEAVREYRQNAEKYEALSESVLESESIPLGHRQTIRRYFELIRPTGNETDAVNERPLGKGVRNQ